MDQGQPGGAGPVAGGRENPGWAGGVAGGKSQTLTPAAAPCGSWLACDSVTPVCLSHRGASIAGKPAPTSTHALILLPKPFTRACDAPAQPPYTFALPALAAAPNPRQRRPGCHRRPQRRGACAAAVDCLRTDRRSPTRIWALRSHHPSIDRLPVGLVLAPDLRAHGRHLHRALRQHQPTGRARLPGLHHPHPVADLPRRGIPMVARPAALRRVGELCLPFGGAGFHPGCRRSDRLGATAQPARLGFTEPGHGYQWPAGADRPSWRVGPRVPGPGAGYIAGRYAAQVPGATLADIVDRLGVGQPGGMAVAGDVRACGTGQFVYWQTAAVQPVADGSGSGAAPAAQCRGGGNAGVGDQPVDCPFAVRPLATTARRQPGSTRPGFIQHRGRIFFRIPVSRIVHPLGPQL